MSRPMEKNVRFGGRFHIVNKATGEPLESYAHKVNADAALQFLESRPADQGRFTVKELEE